MADKTKDNQAAVDANQEAYRKKFGIVDKYLIDIQWEPEMIQIMGI